MTPEISFLPENVIPMLREGVLPPTEMIYLDGNIDQSVTKEVINTLRIASLQPDKQIVLRLNSNGGGLQNSLDILKQMRRMDNPITTICEARAMSGAALLLSAGDPGYRFAYEDSEIMLHQIQFNMEGWSGSAPEFFKFAKRNLKSNQNFMREMSSYLKISHEELLKKTQEDWYMGAQEALEIGLIDEVILLPRRERVE